MTLWATALIIAAFVLGGASVGVVVVNHFRGDAKAISDAQVWAVFNWDSGELFNVSPATQLNAEREAQLAGPGHEAFEIVTAAYLRRAYAHGRDGAPDRHMPHG
ncbi:hypothetical protein [Leifsonia sp. Leaf264]|uniref:hypothetical protein n=1 Tax=Leifsonia sp. Leaf264 TaxID=1736314 RepID=UPI0006F5E9D0|nr:hypothetical protein [Leifsonia sp. Leaf264]KQO98580.1 hypothetical protein ASF30_10995 [Leifsonia sp. Leaf264]